MEKLKPKTPVAMEIEDEKENLPIPQPTKTEVMYREPPVIAEDSSSESSDSDSEPIFSTSDSVRNFQK